MELIGVAKTRPNFEAETALRKGYSLYSAIPERSHRFTDAGMELDGTVEDLAGESDVIVDATPAARSTLRVGAAFVPRIRGRTDSVSRPVPNWWSRLPCAS